jgi:hypothetical protein
VYLTREAITGPLRATFGIVSYNHSVPKRSGAEMRSAIRSAHAITHQRQRGHAPSKLVGVLRIVMDGVVVGLGHQSALLCTDLLLRQRQFVTMCQ